MDIAILYSGGKDSTLAIELARQKGWNIKYLLSVKPTRKDCYLFHFATVEHTKELAKILNYNHILANCEVADPVKEAKIIKDIVAKNPVEAVILGGVGLQELQLNTIRDTLFPLGVEVFVSHKAENEIALLQEMINKKYEIYITEVAAEGLNEDYLGFKIDNKTLPNFIELSQKYGFNVLGEGGHYNTLVVDGPIFEKRFQILDFKTVMDNEFSGHLEIKDYVVKEKKSKILPLF